MEVVHVVCPSPPQQLEAFGGWFAMMQQPLSANQQNAKVGHVEMYFQPGQRTSKQLQGHVCGQTGRHEGDERSLSYLLKWG